MEKVLVVVSEKQSVTYDADVRWYISPEGRTLHILDKEGNPLASFSYWSFITKTMMVDPQKSEQKETPASD